MVEMKCGGHFEGIWSLAEAERIVIKIMCFLTDFRTHKSRDFNFFMFNKLFSKDLFLTNVK